MKRFHVHVAVDDLAQSTRFYSALFGAQPTVEKGDYAKWMLDDPRINFAISKRGTRRGINHLGLQVDSDAELQELQQQHRAADLAMFNQGETQCCYAQSNKHWVTDPQGVAWEMYHSMAQVETWDGSAVAPADNGAKKASCATPASASGSCCSPARETADATAPKQASAGCSTACCPETATA